MKPLHTDPRPFWVAKLALMQCAGVPARAMRAVAVLETYMDRIKAAGGDVDHMSSLVAESKVMKKEMADLIYSKEMKHLREGAYNGGAGKSELQNGDI